MLESAQQSYTSIQEVAKQQMSFGGGVNAQAPGHLLPADQVQTATNIDFQLWPGAARARRGWGTYITTTYTHSNAFKSYWDQFIGDWSLYSYHGSAVGRVTATNGTIGTYTQIMTAGGAPAGFGKYNSFVYIAGGPAYYKDDGTNTTEWIKQSPSAPTITLNTGATLIISSATVVPQAEGTFQYGSSGTNTYIANGTTGRVTLLSTAGYPLNLATNSGFATDTIGVVYAAIGFSDPTNIYRVSIDLAIDPVTYTTAVSTVTNTVTNGTTTTTATETLTSALLSGGFQNYWHAEYLPNNGTFIDSALAAIDDLTGGANVISSGGTNTAVTSNIIAGIQSQINSDAATPITQVVFQGGVLSALGIPKTSFNLVGTSGTSTADSWSAITAFRLVVESLVTAQNTLLGTIGMLGDEGHVLTDQNNGYLWYQTYAQIDASGNFLGESAPSPAAGPFKCSAASAVVVTNGTATGSQAGITHIITYRQGGFVQSPYAVNTQTYGTKTMTDTVSDVNELLMNTPMVFNIYNKSSFPADVSVMAPEAWYQRMFLANGNVLIWSTAGRPDQFPINSYAQISHSGDLIKGLSVWLTGLVIINEQSVYEMNGSVFEGPNADYVIYKSGARKGSIAPNTIIKTPYGIPLVNYDGISMYQPGAGVEMHLDWVTTQIGDAFRGFGGDDPAALNGGRVPAVNGNIFKATAAYNEGKLYIAMPTGTNTINDTVFILDFATQKCWWYQYEVVNQGPAGFYGLLWDFQNNDMYAAGVNGFYQIENFVVEPTIATDTATATHTTSGPVPWNFTTREWDAPTDTLVENIAVEYVGGPIQVVAVYDATNTCTLGTLTSSTKAWTLLPLSATVENSMYFQFSQVTSTAYPIPQIFFPTAIYQITWDAYPHPEKCQFYQTNYDNNNYEGDKLWDVEFFDVGFLQSNANTGTNTITASGTTTTTGTLNAIGTLTATTFVDGYAVMTNTLVGSSTANAGRNIFTFSFPSETYGEVAYTVMTATVSMSGTAVTGPQQVFKLWNHNYQARNEPPKVTYWHTDWESMEENICDGWDTDINPNGTVLGTAFIDNVAIATGTYTGSKRQSFTFNWPVEEYGRTIYVEYNSAHGNTFKHYKTWYHLRQEPDRWTSYVSTRESTVEQHFDNVESELNCLGNTVLATAYVDNIAIDTYTYTSTGSIQRERFVSAVPAETYGKTVYVQYNSTGRFKWFHTKFNGTEEPDRVNFLQKILPPWPSEQYAKTWIVEINPLGTTTGNLYVEGSIIANATFTGTIREIFNVGIDASTTVALQTATAIEARYGNVTGTQLLKHYKTEIEVEPKPYGKNSWAITFRKLGGASQIDIARFHSLDVEVPPTATATVTTIWDIENQLGFSTNTFTFTSGRNYLDLCPFPPGGRGRLFQERLISSVPIKVWRAILYEERVGVKGFTTTAVVGKPVT
jgi:hypothetical protein